MPAVSCPRCGGPTRKLWLSDGRWPGETGPFANAPGSRTKPNRSSRATSSRVFQDPICSARRAGPGWLSNRCQGTRDWRSNGDFATLEPYLGPVLQPVMDLSSTHRGHYILLSVSDLISVNHQKVDETSCIGRNVPTLRVDQEDTGFVASMFIQKQDKATIAYSTIDHEIR